jgi:hypothetical protein
MRTFDDAPDYGLYENDCCLVQVVFFRNDTLCRCPQCERLCTWDLLEATALPEQLAA